MLYEVITYERGVFYASEFAAEDAGLDSLVYVDRAEYKPSGTVAEMAADSNTVTYPGITQNPSVSRALSCVP